MEVGWNQRGLLTDMGQEPKLEGYAIGVHVCDEQRGRNHSPQRRQVRSYVDTNHVSEAWDTDAADVPEYRHAKEMP